MHPNRKKGFTLFQMLFILMMITICLLLLHKNQLAKTSLRYESMKIRELLLQAQEKAIFDKKKIVSEISNNTFISDRSNYEMPQSISCGNHYITFNQRGNVNQARTIVCKQENQKIEIVVNLGAGNIYVR